MKQLLTDRHLAALKPAAPGRRYLVHDALVPGLQVRVTAHGHRTFMLGARWPGSSNYTRRELGIVGVMTLAQARAKAREWLGLLAQGTDPGKQQQPALMFGAVAASYIKRRLPGQRKAARVTREIQKELLPAWGARPLTAITRRDVVDLLESVVDRGRTGAYARTIFSHIKCIFDFAALRYDLPYTPVDRLKPKAICGVKRVRQRVLDDAELAALWAATDFYPWGYLVRLLLLTGARANEIAGASWSEIDSKRRVLTVPAARFKMNAQHVIALSDAAWELLQALPRGAAGDYIFSTSAGYKPVNGPDAKRALKVAITDWQIHDLRRTMRTRLAELHIPDHVAELVLGHSKRGLKRIYDQHRYSSELAAAWQAWATRLQSIVAPPPNNSRVVPLRAGQR
jgi:integrase